MATQSFDGSIKVNKKSAKSFDTILNSKKRTTISKIPVAKDADGKFLGSDNFGIADYTIM